MSEEADQGVKSVVAEDEYRSNGGVLFQIRKTGVL